MPEIDNNQAAGDGADNGAGEGEKPETDTGSDQGTDTDKKPEATDDGKEDAGEGEGEGAEGEKDTSKGQKNAKAPNNKDSKKETSKEDDDDNAEPEVRPRMSTKDFIIGRQHKKLSKAKAGEGEGEGEHKDNEEANEDDDEIAPEDEELITKVVAKRFAPILDKALSAEDENEIQEFVKTNPDFKPFEAKVRRFMRHPSRRQLPVKSIFYEVAGDKLLSIGAKRQTEADKKAKDTQTGGGSNRAGGGTKSVKEMSNEEFEAKKEKVRRGEV